MGAIQPVLPVKLLIGNLTGFPELEGRIAEDLACRFGPVDLLSPVLEFSYTDYYREQMGPALRRTFFSFDRLIHPNDLAGIKNLCNRLEVEYSSGEFPVMRPVNLDPGYMEMGKLVLASTKNHSHRIYLGEGIYAEVTLVYRGKKFQGLEWTYPDYRSQEYHGFFQKVRDRYHAQLLDGGLLGGRSRSL